MPCDWFYPSNLNLCRLEDGIFCTSSVSTTEPGGRRLRRTGVEWPFVGSEAVAGGLVTRHDLAIRNDSLYRNVHVPRGEQVTSAQRAHAAWLWSRRQATLVKIGRAHV